MIRLRTDQEKPIPALKAHAGSIRIRCFKVGTPWSSCAQSGHNKLSVEQISDLPHEILLVHPLEEKLEPERLGPHDEDAGLASPDEFGLDEEEPVAGLCGLEHFRLQDSVMIGKRVSQDQPGRESMNTEQTFLLFYWAQSYDPPKLSLDLTCLLAVGKNVRFWLISSTH